MKFSDRRARVVHRIHKGHSVIRLARARSWEHRRARLYPRHLAGPAVFGPASSVLENRLPPPTADLITYNCRCKASVATLAVCCIIGIAASAFIAPPVASADNTRLNNGVVVNVYTVRQQAGCTTDIKISPQLRLAAQWHTDDLINNHDLDGDIGSDGSTVQNRAQAAGYPGTVAETVSMRPAVAINGIDIISDWYYRPDSYAIMSNCANTQIGVWSENSPSRSVVVAVYGQPS